jgi:hypothetical protein
VQIGHVAGDVYRRDLALALRVLTEAANKTCDDQASMIHLLSVGNEVAIGLHMLRSPGQIEDGLLLLFCED